MQALETTGIQQWNKELWSQQKNSEKQFNFGDYVLWFPKGNKSPLGKFTKKWFGLYIVQYVLPNNIVLINVNKLKPYKYMESKVQEQEQQVYWEQSVGELQEDDSIMEVEAVDNVTQKPHMQDPKVNTILILEL
jgi:hypothetical protein